MKNIVFFSTCIVFLTKCPSHMTLFLIKHCPLCLRRKSLISWVSCILSQRADVSTELFLQAWCLVDCDEELLVSFILLWSVNMSLPHLVSCQRQCTYCSISIFLRCLKMFLFPSAIHPFIHYSYILFFSIGWVLSSPTSKVLLESLPNWRALVTNHQF